MHCVWQQPLCDGFCGCHGGRLAREEVERDQETGENSEERR